MKCEKFSSQIDDQVRGMWKFHRFFANEIPSKFWQADDIGDTKLELIEVSDKKLWLKREDTNPQGSHKDRSLAYQVSLAASQGAKELVISSSGNAALSAAVFCRQTRMKLWAFLSPEINRRKFQTIKKNKAQIIVSRRASRLANYLVKQKGIRNLRPSIADESLEGFKTISFELLSQLPKELPIFTFVTSGSSLLGMYQGWKQLQALGCMVQLPPINAVMTGEKSVAGKGGTRRSRRRQAVSEAIKASGGEKYIIPDSAIISAQEILRRHDIKSSPEGAAAMAAMLKSPVEEAVCIISGRGYSEERLQPSDYVGVERAEDLSDIDKLIK